MAEVIRGHEGSITADGIPVIFVDSWEANLEVEEGEAGPFIGDGGFVYTYTISRRLTGTIEATVPKNKNAGQTTLISGALHDNPVSLVLATDFAYTFTIPSGTMSNFSYTQDAGETVTFSVDFSSNGAFTVT
jgi:hypothetical protein